MEYKPKEFHLLLTECTITHISLVSTPITMTIPRSQNGNLLLKNLQGTILSKQFVSWVIYKFDWYHYPTNTMVYIFILFYIPPL